MTSTMFNRAKALIQGTRRPSETNRVGSMNTDQLSALIAQGGTNPPEWDVILTAAQKNKPREVQRLIDQEGIPASHANVVGQTGLHIAALWGSVESLNVLIKAGADVNAQNRIAGSTPLICAVKGTFQSFKETHSRRLECLKLLLDAGADASVSDNRGRDAHKSVDDAIREAGMRGVFGIEDQMEEMREALEAVGFSGPKRSALAQCVGKNDDRGVRHCIEYEGADGAEVREGLLNAVMKFVKLVDERSEATDELKPLKNIILCLLKADADPNVQPPDTKDPDSLKEAPLHKICSSLSAGYSPGPEPAVVDLAHDVVVDLVERGAKVGTRTMALLPNAALRGDVRSVRLLTETVGVDVNFRGKQGMTALHLAARSGRGDVVRMLLEDESVEVDLADDRGKKAVDYATANRKAEIVTLLQGQGFSKGLLAAVETFRSLVDERSDEVDAFKSLKDTIHNLLGAGADPNARPPASTGPDPLADAPLHVICSSVCNAYQPGVETAAVGPAADIAQELVARGAKLCSKTMALLPNAALRGDVRSVEMLTGRAGVDPNFRGRQGMTALHLAARGGKADVVRALLENGSVDVGAADDLGKTAVDYATANKKAAIVEMLQSHTSS